MTWEVTHVSKRDSSSRLSRSQHEDRVVQPVVGLPEVALAQIRHPAPAQDLVAARSQYVVDDLRDLLLERLPANVQLLARSVVRSTCGNDARLASVCSCHA